MFMGYSSRFIMDLSVDLLENYLFQYAHVIIKLLQPLLSPVKESLLGRSTTTNKARTTNKVVRASHSPWK